jgi:hypothetical protein
MQNRKAVLERLNGTQDAGPDLTGHILSFEEIMAAEDTGEATVPVPEWGGSVVIRGLAREEYLAIEEKSMDKVPGKPNERTQNTTRLEELLLEATLVRPTLTREQVAALRKNKGVKPIGELVGAILRHIGAMPEVQREDVASFLPDAD